MKRFLLMSASISVFAAIPGTVCAESAADEWKFQITPYIWLPTIDGTLNYELPPGGGGSPDIEVGPTDWLDLLNVGVLIGGSAKKGRFSLAADFVYLSMTRNDDARVVSVDGTISGPGGVIQVPVGADVSLNTRSDLDGLLWTLAAGYTVQQTENSIVDVFVGARLFSLETSTSWELTAAITGPGGEELLPGQGGIGQDTDLWDGIVGVRGDIGFAGGNWSVPFHFDIGAGSSDLTWNAMTGLTRHFDWGDILFVYRHLEYDEDSEGLMQNFSFSGPAFGATFRF